MAFVMTAFDETLGNLPRKKNLNQFLRCQKLETIDKETFNKRRKESKKLL